MVLEPREWQQVLNFLSGAPYRDVAPLIAQISRQLSAAQEVQGNGSAKPVESQPPA